MLRKSVLRHADREERAKRQAGWRPDIPGRAEFLRDNAPSLIAERDAKIARLRKRIVELERMVRRARRPARPAPSTLSVALE